MATAPPFNYVDIMAQPNKQKVEYRKLTDQGVKVVKLGDKQFLQVCLTTASVSVPSGSGHHAPRQPRSPARGAD